MPPRLHYSLNVRHIGACQLQPQHQYGQERRITIRVTTAKTQYCRDDRNARSDILIFVEAVNHPQWPEIVIERASQGVLHLGCGGHQGRSPSPRILPIISMRSSRPG